ncbi:MAG: hypothetical protein ACFHXK_07485 [bacterium]
MAASVQAWFESLVPLHPDKSETAYCQSWCHQLGDASGSEFMRAVRGGWLAGNLSQVFIAGYQAAIRQTFSNPGLTGIAAFAVSEDRSTTSPLPGVIWHPHAEGVMLSGYKTWVAAIAQVEHLIVKARGKEAGQSGFFVVPVTLEKVQLDEYPAPSRLPGLSQGRAFLDQVVLPATGRLDSAHVADFARHEALFIYSAFLALVWRSTPDGAKEKAAAGALLEDMEQHFAAQTSTLDLSSFDEQVQSLRQQLAGGRWSEDADFLRDQSLIAMYSRVLGHH